LKPSFFTLLRLQMAHLVAIADMSIIRKKIAEHAGTLSEKYFAHKHTYAVVSKIRERNANEHTCIKEKIH
jgi:hypothetical protein